MKRMSCDILFAFYVTYSDNYMENSRYSISSKICIDVQNNGQVM